ncbi:MAG: hypothetical protein HS132_12290 [Planctomycetia bacterium]|nr:hypothetical protein [Planctomycetia bacterium]
MKSLKYCKVVLFCLFFVFLNLKDVKSEVVSGILEKMVVCGEVESESFYFIDTGTKRISFKPPPNMRLPAGSKMTVEGKRDDKMFVGEKINRLDDWNPPPIKTTGDIKTAVLMSYTTDNSPPSSTSREAVYDEAFNNPNQSLNAFYKEASWDQNGNAQIWFSGDTYGWYVLPKDSAYYDGDYDLIMEDTIKVADPYVNFLNYDLVIIVCWNQFKSSAAYHSKLRFETGDGTVWLSACFLNYDRFFMGGIKQHEMGHTFGECWAHGGGTLVNDDQFCMINELIVGITDDYCTVNTYFDKYDIMGNGSGFNLPSMWRRKHAEWLTSVSENQ